MLIAIIFVTIPLIIITGIIASNKGRSVFGWMFLSLFISPLVSIIVLIALGDTEKKRFQHSQFLAQQQALSIKQQVQQARLQLEEKDKTMQQPTSVMQQPQKTTVINVIGWVLLCVVISAGSAYIGYEHGKKEMREWFEREVKPLIDKAENELRRFQNQ